MQMQHEKSQNLMSHEKDINKFEVPSLTTRLHKNDVWQIWEYRLKMLKDDVCAEV
jgi:hypothetical protein